MAKKADSELPVLAAIDASLPDAPELTSFRAWWVEGHRQNPAAFAQYDATYAAVMASPLDKQHMPNVRAARRLMRKCRGWLKTKLKISIGTDWKMTTPNWSAFFAAIESLMKIIIPMFSTCVVPVP